MSLNAMGLGFTIFVNDLASQAFRQVRRELNNLAAASPAAAAAVTRATNQMRAGALAVAVGLGTGHMVSGIIKDGAAMRNALNAAIAKQGDFADNIAGIERKLLEVAGRSTFTSKQVAEGFATLAAAGFDARDSMFAIDGVVNAAQAAGTTMDKAAGIVGGAIRAFGLGTDQSTYIADVLAKSANSSAIGIEDLGQTLKYVGPVAKLAGADIETVSGLAAILGNDMIKASMSGTGMRRMFTNLLGAGKGAKEALAQIGVGTVDKANNRMRSMLEILPDIAEKTKDWPIDQKMQVFQKLVGQYGLSSFMSLMNKDSKTLRNMVDGMRQSFGSARKASDVMLSGLGGSFKLFSSQIDVLRTQLYLGMEKPLLFVMDIINKFLKIVRAIPEPILRFAGAIMLLVPAFLLVWGAQRLFLGARGMWAVWAASNQATIAAIRTSLITLGLQFLAVLAIGALFVMAWKHDFLGLRTFTEQIFGKINLWFQAIGSLMKNGMISGELYEQLEKAGILEFVTQSYMLLRRFKAFFEGMWFGFQESIRPAIEVFETFYGSLRDFFREIGIKLPEFDKNWRKNLGTLGQWRSLGRSLGQALTWIIPLIGSLVVLHHVSSGVVNVWRAMNLAVSGIALLGNPVTWIVLGIVALAAAIGYAIYQWKSMKASALETMATIYEWLAKIPGIGNIYKEHALGLRLMANEARSEAVKEAMKRDEDRNKAAGGADNDKMLVRQYMREKGIPARPVTQPTRTPIPAQARPAGSPTVNVAAPEAPKVNNNIKVTAIMDGKAIPTIVKKEEEKQTLKSGGTLRVIPM